jgi:hypothetical protein
VDSGYDLDHDAHMDVDNHEPESGAVEEEVKAEDEEEEEMERPKATGRRGKLNAEVDKVTRTPGGGGAQFGGGEDEDEHEEHEEPRSGSRDKSLEVKSGKRPGDGEGKVLDRGNPKGRKSRGRASEAVKRRSQGCVGATAFTLERAVRISNFVCGLASQVREEERGGGGDGVRAQRLRHGGGVTRCGPQRQEGPAGWSGQSVHHPPHGAVVTAYGWQSGEGKGAKLPVRKDGGGKKVPGGKKGDKMKKGLSPKDAGGRILLIPQELYSASVGTRAWLSSAAGGRRR